MQRPWLNPYHWPTRYFNNNPTTVDQMQFQLDIQIQKPEELIRYGQKIMLVGSCFTEHIGRSMQDLKFDILQNPNGILFDPASVCQSLVSYLEGKRYDKKDLFYLNEVWTTWQHHSRFSHIDPVTCLERINESQQTAGTFIQTADWLIITLGSSFSYRLTNQADLASQEKGSSVANCHRAPAQWFEKHLMEISETTAALDEMIHRLRIVNPQIKILFTISPVRHIRDGLIQNNRSKARLIESVHQVVNKFENAWYFPAYELVIDVLRDYRYYDIDLVHPNYPATDFVMEKFMEVMVDEESRLLSQELRRIAIARNHRPFQPETKAHQQFLKQHFQLTSALQAKYPNLNLKDELDYFGSYKEPS